MKVYAASDHHFFHKNIIKYTNRPFDFNCQKCVIDNARVMIERHNEIITNDDYIIMLGDLSADLRGRQPHLHRILKLLKGKKILIRGNHDYESDDFYKDSGFLDILNYLEIGKYFISHYPCYESRWIQKQEKEHLKIINRDKCEIVIHGHIHNKNPNDWEPDGLQRINVCVDYEPNNFYPIELRFEEIVNYFNYKYR